MDGRQEQSIMEKQMEGKKKKHNHSMKSRSAW